MGLSRVKVQGCGRKRMGEEGFLILVFCNVSLMNKGNGNKNVKKSLHSYIISRSRKIFFAIRESFKSHTKSSRDFEVSSRNKFFMNWLPKSEFYEASKTLTFIIFPFASRQASFFNKEFLRAILISKFVELT